MDSKAEITSVLNIFARCSLAMFLKTSWGATSPGVLEAKQIFDACDQNQAPGRSQHTGGLKGGLNPKMRPVRSSEENGDAERIPAKGIFHDVSPEVVRETQLDKVKMVPGMIRVGFFPAEDILGTDHTQSLGSWAFWYLIPSTISFMHYIIKDDYIVVFYLFFYTIDIYWLYLK